MQPRLTSLAVRDFQSLARVTIPIGRFTAIVGPSNVGKSALTRALRTLARNGPSTGLVRRGATKLTVAAKFSDGTAVAISRGPRESRLTIARPDGTKMAFAKLGIDMPTEARDLWRSPVSDLGDLTFSTQHDPPYMLTAPGSAVARQLGELTNAATLTEAVREANRRRARANDESQTRRRELAEATEELRGLVELKRERERLDRAERALDDADSATAMADSLAAAMASRTGALDLERQAEEAEGRRDRINRGIAGLTATAKLLGELGAILAQRERAEADEHVARQMAENHEAYAADLRKQAREALEEAGTCPLCGADTRGNRDNPCEPQIT